MNDILHNFNLFVDGYGHAGQISEFKPPKVAVKTEDFEAGGIAAPLAVPMGTLEKLEAEFTVITLGRNVLPAMRVLPGNTVPLTARGTAAGNDGIQRPVVINMQGNIVEIDTGAWKPGAKVETKVKIALTYYKHTIDGNVVFEIDPVNYVANIGGKDQLATARQHLGI